MTSFGHKIEEMLVQITAIVCERLMRAGGGILHTHWHFAPNDRISQFCHTAALTLLCKHLKREEPGQKIQSEATDDLLFHVIEKIDVNFNNFRSRNALGIARVRGRRQKAACG